MLLGKRNKKITTKKFGYVVYIVLLCIVKLINSKKLLQ